MTQFVWQTYENAKMPKKLRKEKQKAMNDTRDKRGVGERQTGGMHEHEQKEITHKLRNAFYLGPTERYSTLQVRVSY